MYICIYIYLLICIYPCKYGCISLTVIACKASESIITKHMRDYLTSNNLMCPQQHGFMPQWSAFTNLFHCDGLMAQYLKARKPRDIFFLDSIRAFEKVSHRILQNTLVSLGISGKLYQWLADFIRDRSQFVSYCGASILCVANC